MRINGACGMAHQSQSTQSGVQHHIQNHQAPASTSSVQPQIESSQNPSRNHHYNRGSRLDPARKIQRWYRANRKRCMRREESVFCAIAPNILQDFFDRPSVELGPDVPQWRHNTSCDELASQDDRSQRMKFLPNCGAFHGSPVLVLIISFGNRLPPIVLSFYRVFLTPV